MNDGPEKPQPNHPAARDPRVKRTYEPPQLRKYGSLAELTRSGTGTVMEMGMGPNTRFA